MRLLGYRMMFVWNMDIAIRLRVGAGHARPATLRRRLLLFCIVERGLDPSAGRRGRRPLQGWPEIIPTPMHARGGLRSGRPTISRSRQSVGEGFIPPGPLSVIAYLPVHSVGAAYMPPAPSGQHPLTHPPPRRGRACPARNFTSADADGLGP